MTKNEVKDLIRKKMEAAEKDYFESFAKKRLRELHLLSGCPSRTSGCFAGNWNVG